MSQPAVQIERLTHRYGQRAALDGLSLTVDAGQLFGILGPNGSGKTTLFRILSTLITPSDPASHVRLIGNDVVVERDAVRRSIGVVFQSPSLDKQLTAEENLRHHGHLYGIRGIELRERIERMLTVFGMADRARERVDSLSGGLRRRVELAKGMLTNPRILILDEPSTGLDPSARIDLWAQLRQVRKDRNITILLTTHLMDEADRCDRLAILDHGKLLACDSPEALKDRIGGDMITMTSEDLPALAVELKRRFSVEPVEIDGTLRFERRRGHEFVPQLIEAVPGAILSISVGRPTLEDVFVQMTGHGFRCGPTETDTS